MAENLAYIDACRERRWSLITWPLANPEAKKLYRYRCNSWRHEGECRRHCLGMDFARIMAALEARECWTFLVLTYPQYAWPNITELFKEGVKHWSRLRKKIDYYYEGMKYIQTWEIHRSGWPHVQVLIQHKGLYNSTRRKRMKTKRELDKWSQQAGFGFLRWIRCVYNKAGMADYFSKVAMELNTIGKHDQLPINAPKHFRRLRASEGLLPPKIKDDKMTGKLLEMSAEVAAELLGIPIEGD